MESRWYWEKQLKSPRHGWIEVEGSYGTLEGVLQSKTVDTERSVPVGTKL